MEECGTRWLCQIKWYKYNKTSSNCLEIWKQNSNKNLTLILRKSLTKSKYRSGTNPKTYFRQRRPTWVEKCTGYSNLPTSTKPPSTNLLRHKVNSSCTKGSTLRTAALAGKEERREQSLQAWSFCVWAWVLIGQATLHRCRPIRLMAPGEQTGGERENQEGKNTPTNTTAPHPCLARNSSLLKSTEKKSFDSHIEHTPFCRNWIWVKLIINWRETFYYWWELSRWKTGSAEAALQQK